MNNAGRWSDERVFATAVFGLSLALLLATVALGSVSRRVPIFVVVPLVVLSGIHLIREFSRSTTVGERTPARWMALGWIGALPFAIYLTGLYAGAGLFTMAFVRLWGRESWAVAVGLAVGVTAGVWLLVGVLMGGSAPAGVIWGIVAGRFD